MFCVSCGKRIDDDSLFCEHCGVPVDNPYLKQNEEITCAQDVEKEPVPSIEQPSLMNSNTSPNEESDNTWHGYTVITDDSLQVERCQNCGYELLPDSMFCDLCGSPVSEPEPVAEDSSKTEPSSAKTNICKACGEEYPEGSVFCDLCGAKISESEQIVNNDSENKEPDKMSCPSCGADLLPGSLFCDMCGASLVPKSEAEEKTTDKCPSCGAELIPGSVFCDMCGIRIK